MSPRPLWCALVLFGVLTLGGSAGATASTTSWVTHGPEGAEVAAFASDPVSGTVYASAGSNVWSSTDGGANWTPAGTTPTYAEWMAAAPGGGVLYESNAFQQCPFARSVDGGATWTRVCTGVSGGGVVEMDDTSGVLFADFSGQVFSSSDQGQSWTAAGTGPATPVSLAVAHGTPDQIYVGTYDGHIWRSDDAGATFTDLGQLVADAIERISIGPSGSVYAVTPTSGAYESTDQGASWAQIDGGHGGNLVIPTATPGTEYLVGSLHDWFTTDDGASWTEADSGLFFNGGGLTQAMWIDPTDPTHLLTSNGADIYRSTDSGSTWSYSSAGMDANQEVRAIAADASGPSTLYAGTHWGGVFVSHDEGGSWAPAGDGLEGDVFTMAVDPTASGTVYVSNGGELFKSTDGAATWNQIDSGFPANKMIWSIAIDPTDDQRVYAAAGSTIERSTDGGATWTPATTSPVQPSGYSILGLTVDESDSSTLYAAGTRVWKSTDYGDTWTPIASVFPGGDFAQSLAQDPGNPAHLLVGGYDSSYESTDGGATWETLQAGGGFVSYDPTGDGTRYIGTGLGIEISPDGQTWATIAGSDTEARYVTGFAFDGAKLIVGSVNGVDAATIVTPTVTTLTPQGFGSRGATIRGRVNPGGQNTTVIFQYGSTTAYGHSTFPTTAGDGSDDITVTDLVQGLAPDTTYHYRAVVIGDSGVAVGADQTFTTYPDQPDVTTGTADSIAPDHADLHAQVTANGLPTTVSFDIGTAPNALGNNPDGSGGSGTTVVDVDYWAFGLQPDTTYYYRVEAQNSAGRTYGQVESFRTAPAPPTMVSVSPAVLTPHGVVGPDSVPVHLQWDSQPGSHPICSHIISESEDGGPYTALSFGTWPQQQADVTIEPRHYQQFSITPVGCDAIHGAGMVGQIVSSKLPQGSRSELTAGAWTMSKSNRDLGGSAFHTTSPDARARFVTKAYNAGWIATTGPHYGRALVSSDGGANWTLVNLHTRHVHHRVIVYTAQWPQNGQLHSIIIHALPTVTGDALSIDGFAMLHMP